MQGNISLVENEINDLMELLASKPTVSNELFIQLLNDLKNHTVEKINLRLDKEF